MGHIEVVKPLSASPADIWKIISDPQTWDKWYTIHAGWLQEPPTSIEQGSKLVEKIVMLGMANKIEWEVVNYNENAKITLAGTGMAGVKVEFSFLVSPAKSGSQFSVVGDFEGALIKGALGKAVEKDFSKQLDKSVSQLEALAATV